MAIEKKVSLNLKIGRNVQNISLFTTENLDIVDLDIVHFLVFVDKNLLAKTCFKIMDSFWQMNESTIIRFHCNALDSVHF